MRALGRSLIAVLAMLAPAAGCAAPEPGPEPAAAKAPAPKEPAQEEARAPGQPVAAAPSLDEAAALALLPADTETIIVCRGPFPFPAAPDETDPAAFAAAGVRIMGMGLIPAFGDESLRATPAPEVALIVEGSRRFELQRIPGVNAYEGCHIVVFHGEIGPFAERLLAIPPPWSAETETVAGHRVRVGRRTHSAAINPDTPAQTFITYLVQPAPDVLITATHRGLLEGVLERLARPLPRVALPPDRPEWAHVDTRAPIWAVRHYDRGNAARDPTSPLWSTKGIRAVMGPNPNAIGTTFQFDPAGGPPLFRHLSGEGDHHEIIARSWRPSDGLAPDVLMPRPGEFAIRCPLPTPAAARMLVFRLSLVLGHAIYL